jgi:hypothetical protein
MSSTIVIFTALDHNVYLQSFGLGLLDRLALACDIRNDRRLGYVHLNAENLESTSRPIQHSLPP